MRFQLSIRQTLFVVAMVSIYCANFALAYRGNVWGMGITFATTCALLVWLMMALFTVGLTLFLRLLGFGDDELNALAQPQPAVKTRASSNERIGNTVNEKGEE